MHTQFTPPRNDNTVTRNDNTVTLIKSQVPSMTQTGSTSSSVAATAGDAAASDAQAAIDCVALIESLTWETAELKDALLELARKQDSQLLAFYRSLKGFPSSFVNVASKYAKFSRKK